MDNDYSVMLLGDFVAGHDPDDVREALAGLFKISPGEVDSLLSKAPVRIKQNVDRDTAMRYKAALEKAGALCDVITPPMDLEDTIPPGGAADLQSAVSASSLAAAAPEQDVHHEPPPDVYAPPASSLEYEEDYTPNLTDPRRVSGMRGVSWIGAGFRSFGRNPLQWLGILLVWLVIMIASGLVPFASTVLQPIFVGGLMLGLLRQENGEDLEFQDLFAGFNEQGGKLALVGIITVGLYIALALIVIVVGLVLGMGSIAALESMAASDQVPLAGGVGLMVLLFLGMTAFLLVVLVVWFAPPLIVFHDVALMDALKLSFIGCLRNWLSFLVVYGTVWFLIFMAGALTLGLAYFVIGPAFMASVYFSYKDIFTD